MYVGGIVRVVNSSVPIVPFGMLRVFQLPTNILFTFLREVRVKLVVLLLNCFLSLCKLLSEAVFVSLRNEKRLTLCILY
jgi:hypothetical protein